MAKRINLDEKEILRLYLHERMTGVEIAAHLGCGATTIMRRLKAHGIDPAKDQRERQGNNRIVDREDVIIAQYRAGRTYQAIANDLNVNPATIYHVLKRRNEPPRRPGGPPKVFTAAERHEIVAARQRGESTMDIAEHMGTTTPKVSKVLREEGVFALYRFRDHKARIDGAGYRLVWVSPDDPNSVMAHSNNYVLEHRLVMARAIGRPLRRDETVHHINGVRTDNALDNLQLRQGAHGRGVVMTCNSCGSDDIGARELPHTA